MQEKAQACTLSCVPELCPTLQPFGLQPARLLCLGFPRQEYWSGLLFPFPGDLPNSRINPAPPALQVDSLPLSHQGFPSSSIK